MQSPTRNKLVTWKRSPRPCRKFSKGSGKASVPTLRIASVILNFPVVQCGNACKNFEENIDRISKLPEVTILDFRDLAHLKYMGEGIDAFRRLLANYKASFIVALANANGCW